jgi:uncharacterized repeat protein (TIGR01451 family)
VLVFAGLAVSDVNAAGPPPADLGVIKSAPPTAAAGSNLTYTITVTNAGPGAASVNHPVHATDAGALAFGVFLSDVLPPQTTFVSLAQSSGPTFACTTPAAGTNGTVSCNIASLASGVAASFSLVVAIAPGASGTVSNTATVNTQNTSDPNSANDAATANTLLTSGAAIPALPPLLLALLAIAFAVTGYLVLRR